MPSIMHCILKRDCYFGVLGIYGVGKAAVNAPALAVLSHMQEGATKTIAWVGKGIVYDTGGLCIKGKVNRTLLYVFAFSC